MGFQDEGQSEQERLAALPPSEREVVRLFERAINVADAVGFGKWEFGPNCDPSVFLALIVNELRRADERHGVKPS